MLVTEIAELQELWKAGQLEVQMTATVEGQPWAGLETMQTLQLAQSQKHVMEGWEESGAQVMLAVTVEAVV